MSSDEEAKEITNFWYGFIHRAVHEFNAPLKVIRISPETFIVRGEEGYEREIIRVQPARRFIAEE